MGFFHFHHYLIVDCHSYTYLAHIYLVSPVCLDVCIVFCQGKEETGESNRLAGQMSSVEVRVHTGYSSDTR